MFIKMKFGAGDSVVELAKFCGCAPCAILAVNGCSEAELFGREIVVPVATAKMIRRIADFWGQKVLVD